MQRNFFNLCSIFKFKMFYLLFILIGSVTSTIVTSITSETKPTLPIPAIVSIKAFAAGFEMTWSPVVSPIIDEPILGYKVSVWEPDIQTVYKYDKVDGANMLIESAVPIDPNIFEPAPRRPPKFSIVTRDLSARFTQVKTGIFYEIRVQALTAKEVGPMSVATSVKLHNPPPAPPKRPESELANLY